MSLLELSEVAAGYRDARQSRAVPVLFDVSLRVEQGEIVALLGPNERGQDDHAPDDRRAPPAAVGRDHARRPPHGRPGP